MTKNLLIGTLSAAALAGGWLLYEHLAAGDAPALPAAASEPPKLSFTLPDLEGRPRSAEEWQGKARLVNFWATWCAPCRREIPLLKDTQANYADRNLQVIGIAVDFEEDVRAYAEKADFNYPVLVGQENAMAVAESSGVSFVGLPFTMVVAPDGTLLGVHMGEIVAAHIDTITTELARLERGEAEVAEVREALRDL